MKRGYIRLFPRKRDLGITKNCAGICFTAITQRFITPCLFITYDLKSKKFFGKIRTAFEESLHKLTGSDHLSYQRRRTSKNIKATLLFSKVFDSIPRANGGANTSTIWSYQKNFPRYNDALQIYASNGSLTQLRLRLLWYYCWSHTRTYIKVLYFKYLPRLQTSIYLIK